MNPGERLRRGLETLGLSLDQDSQGRLLAYLELLHKWNKTYNLTAIREPERMLSHHLLDSLALMPHLGPEPLLDVGSGSGLPGIPLAIARPELPVTLLDGVDKKCAFMRQASIQLGLGNVTVVHARVQDWCPVERFGQIVSRAFSELAEFVALTAHLLAEGGRWLAMKGTRPDAELARLQAVHLVQCIPLSVPGLDAERHLIILERA